MRGVSGAREAGWSPTLAEASQAPETKVFWSGERERDITSPVWPAKVVTWGWRRRRRSKRR